jgi:hypothetical protein
VGLALGAAVMQGAVHLVHVFVLDGRYGALLDAESNRSIFDVVSVVAETCACAASLMLARARPPERHRFLALAGLLAFVTLDDAAGLHNRVGVDWPLILFPVLGCTFLLLWSTLDQRRSRACIRAGLLLLATSVLLGRAAAPMLTAFGWTPGIWLYEIKVVIKQGVELGGWILIAGTLVVAAAIPNVRRAPPRVASRLTATSESP